MIVEGAVGVGDGWWLMLPEPYTGEVTEDGAVALVRDLIAVLPQTTSYAPDSLTVSPADLLAGIVADMAAGDDVTDLGAIHGTGWSGHLFREPIDQAGVEYQLLATMMAAGTLLNLAVRFVGLDTEADARQIIEQVIHDPNSTEAMNAQLREQMGIE
jgi:hypothetical protein